MEHTWARFLDAIPRPFGELRRVTIRDGQMRQWRIGACHWPLLPLLSTRAWQTGAYESRRYTVHHLNVTRSHLRPPFLVCVAAKSRPHTRRIKHAPPHSSLPHSRDTRSRNLQFPLTKPLHRQNFLCLSSDFLYLANYRGTLQKNVTLVINQVINLENFLAAFLP